MAEWTNIANSNLEVGAPIRSLDGIALRDNPIAIAEGASGAPKVQRAAIQDSAINRQKISTSTATTSGTLFSVVNIELNSHAFFPNIRVDGNVTGVPSGGGVDSPRFRLVNTTVGSKSYNIQHRYIES